MMKYEPKPGYRVVYPYDGGSAETADGKYVVGLHWGEVREITAGEGEQLVGELPGNKYAIVFASGLRYVDAVYNHDGRLSIIRTSRLNLIPDTGRGVRLHDVVDSKHRHDDLLSQESAHIQACARRERAVQITADAVGALTRRGYYPMALEPSCVLPRFGGTQKEFVPTMQVTSEGTTFSGKLAFNRFGEAIGIWTGEGLV